MAKNEPQPINSLSFEEAFAELDAITTVLESGEKSLEESMTLFGRGQALVKHCSALLDKAELKVKVLAGETLEDFQEEP